ncbi:protein notum, partial [Trifolium pratense]
LFVSPPSSCVHLSLRPLHIAAVVCHLYSSSPTTVVIVYRLRHLTKEELTPTTTPVSSSEVQWIGFLCIKHGTGGLLPILVLIDDIYMILGLPLKSALLINYDPTGPSRLLSTVAEQEGMKVNIIELRHFVDFVRNNKLQTESFYIGSNQFVNCMQPSHKSLSYLVTSIHENWFSARCINTSKPAGEGAIVLQTAAYILVALYEGSIGPASRAMSAADQLTGQLVRKNL